LVFRAVAVATIPLGTVTVVVAPLAVVNENLYSPQMVEMTNNKQK